MDIHAASHLNTVLCFRTGAPHTGQSPRDFWSVLTMISGFGGLAVLICSTIVRRLRSTSAIKASRLSVPSAMLLSRDSHLPVNRALLSSSTGTDSTRLVPLDVACRFFFFRSMYLRRIKFSMILARSPAFRVLRLSSLS